MERRTAKIHEAMREWGHENAAWLRKAYSDCLDLNSWDALVIEGLIIAVAS